MRALAIADARPERMVTLTRVGDDWQRIRERVKDLRRRVRECNRAVEWVWTVEANPRGTGHHVHAWQRGGYLPQSLLARLAVRCGMGQVTDVRAWTTHDDSAGYGLKQASAGYGLKATSGGDPLGWLGLNGGRLTHQSRGFFPEGVRTCERAALERRADGLGAWEIVSDAALDWVKATGEHVAWSKSQPAGFVRPTSTMRVTAHTATRQP